MNIDWTTIYANSWDILFFCCCWGDYSYSCVMVKVNV